MIEMQDVLILMLIVLLLFAPSRLPLLARSLREGIENFRDSTFSDRTESQCERCRAPLSGLEYRCPKCRQVTPTGWLTFISLAVAVASFTLAFFAPSLLALLAPR